MTLVELLITVVIGLLIFGAVLNLLVVGLHKQKAITSRVDSLQQARVGEARLTRELRQATLVSVTNAGSGVAYTLPAQGALAARAVTWICLSGGVCTRTVSASAKTAMTGVSNAGTTPVIFAMPAINQVTVQLQITVNAKTFTLQDAVNLRNVAAP